MKLTEFLHKLVDMKNLLSKYFFKSFLYSNFSLENRWFYEFLPIKSGKTRNSFASKNILWNKLFTLVTSFVCKTFTFTKFVLKRCLREFPVSPHCERWVLPLATNFYVKSIFTDKTHSQFLKAWKTHLIDVFGTPKLISRKIVVEENF